MKKKLLTVVLSVVLCLGMSVTAIAAPSPVQIPGTNMGSTTIDQVYSSLTDEEKATVDAVNAAGGESGQMAYLQLIAENLGVSTSPTTVVKRFVTRGFTGVASFYVPGVVPGQRVTMLHVKENGQWEVISDASVKVNDYVTGTFTSASPVYILPEAIPAEIHTHYWQDRIVAPTATTWGYTEHYCAGCGESYADNYIAPTSAAGRAAASPKTTESSVPVIMLFAAAALAGGAVVYTRRRHA